ncbi:hypothetical protein Pst134EA_015194 [Puccinia striiformis f. sp. tritici]|uniref:hypothetical protein n=1 Tax=Puccinia striiformis f. sp. tritici TaxID=168172 RepID=UPI002007211B|nr:hypothetical protein Pst134EA_015194 [Puccinia striiformis f. sp. tritici]KAH9463111.1 hypothetical protein Pst134EA_015194 [Puccinia striiformis f. sp. tritici]
MVAFNFGVIAASLLAIALVVADPNNERLAARELSPEAQTKGRVSDKLDSLGKNLKWLDEAVNQENLNSRVARERMAGYYQLFQDSFQYAIDCGSLCFQSGSVVNVSAYEAFKQMNQLAKDVAQKYGSGASTVLSPFSAYDGSIYRRVQPRRYPTLQPSARRFCRFYGEGGIPSDRRSCYPNERMNVAFFVFTLNSAII